MPQGWGKFVQIRWRKARGDRTWSPGERVRDCRSSDGGNKGRDQDGGTQDQRGGGWSGEHLDTFLNVSDSAWTGKNQS